YRERKAVELAAAEHDLATAERRITEVGRKTQQTREKQARRDRAGRQQKARDDIPRIILGREKDYAEKHAGDSARLAARQREQARTEAQSAREKIEVLQPVTVSVPPTNLPPSRKVLTLDAVSAGYDPENPVLRDFSLAITGPERVAVIGPNGS